MQSVLSVFIRGTVATKAEIEDRLHKIARKAYLMVLSPGEPESPVASKFGGTPYSEDGQWPACSCSRPLRFICQLNLAACPLLDCQPPNINLVQFFYCFQCFPCDDKQNGWLIRLCAADPDKFVRPNEPATPEPRGLGERLLRFLRFNHTMLKPCKVHLAEILSLPDWQDLESDYAEIVAEIDRLEDVDATDYYCELIEKFAGHEQFDIDCVSMIGGYPLWIQGGDSRFCKVCSARMEFFMSVASECDTGLNFGDAGTVYFFNCREHRDQFAMYMEMF